MTPRARWLGLWWAGFGALCFGVLLWGSLRAAAAGISLPLVGSVVLSKTVSTGLVYNGSSLTYTLQLTNTGSTTATNINLLDPLPEDAFANITCMPECGRVTAATVFTDPTGGVITITVVRQLTWTVPNLAPGATQTFSFTAQVVGQADGRVLTNLAYASYEQGGTQATSSNVVNTTVRVFVPQDGQPALARTTTWFSEDFGGTIAQDWGDFDRDGDLDLALASSVGTSVYRNEAGQMGLFWNDPRRSYGVRWVDVDGNGAPELIVVGNSDDGTTNGQGLNYVFQYANNTLSESASWSFNSAWQLARVAVGDFNSDQRPDLVVSTNAINAPCPVVLYTNQGGGFTTNALACVSTEATAALSVGDYDNDDSREVALGVFPDKVILLKLVSDSGGTIVSRQVLLLESSVPFLPYDFAWGDYNRDGYLDLAAAYPLLKELRLYRNTGTGQFARPQVFRTDAFLTPLGADWEDFNGDGWLDLVVADANPKVYLNQAGALAGDRFLASSAVQGQVWSIRAARSGVGGNLQLALARRDGPSYLYPAYAAYLDPALLVLETSPGNSLAWGDLNRDAYQDLLIGAGPLGVAARVYINKTDGTWPSTPRTYPNSGLGPHEAAFGDVNGDGQLDVAMAFALGNVFNIQVYLAEATAPNWTATLPGGNPFPVLVWGDINDDGRLDLLVGGNDVPVQLYLNQGTTLTTTPRSLIPQEGDIREMALTDINRDYYPDLAVAFFDQATRVYRNNDGDGTFTLVWTSPAITGATSVAWGDYDHNGFPDLAVGAFDQPVRIYSNLSGTLTSQPVWSSPTVSRTTSVAWGDWNNDGYEDLAVGNEGAPVQVFANLASSSSSPNLYWLWTSQAVANATQVAWGDADRDGDLDLALAQNGSGPTGFFRNNLVVPGHVVAGGQNPPAQPQAPSYVAVLRPGRADDAYFYSTAEMLGQGTATTITVRYRQYNAAGGRAAPTSNVPGTPLANTLFEYSLDGGSTWQPATRAMSSTTPTTQTSRLGVDNVFVWDAGADGAISNEARFRVLAVAGDAVGPVHRAANLGVSPPFRVRGVECVWPAVPTIVVSTTTPAANEAVRFQGFVQSGSGVLTFTWDFGDGSPTLLGQTMVHSYTTGVYLARLRVQGAPCPVNRETVASVLMVVGNPKMLYLPLVSREGNFLTSTPADLPQGVIDVPAPVFPAPVAWPVPGHTSSLAPALAAEGGAPAVSLAPQAPFTSATVIQITPGSTAAGFNNDPTINTDGTRVAFWSTADLTGGNWDGNIELFVAGLDFSDPVTVTAAFTQLTYSMGSILGGFNLGPSSNAAGDVIAFFSDRDLTWTGRNADSNFEVFLAQEPTPGNYVITQVTDSTGGFNILPALAAWPDPGNGNLYLAFISDRNFPNAQNADGNSELFRATVPVSGAVTYLQVTHSASGSADQPAISGDGRRLVFVSDQPGLGVNSFNPDGNREIFYAFIAPNGVITITQLTSTTVNVINTQPTISAHGRRLAFVSDQNLYLANISVNGVPGVATAMGLTGDQPSLSQDGLRLAYLAADRQNVELYDLFNGQPLPVAGTSTSDIFNPQISGDGTQIALASNRQIYLAGYPYAELTVNKYVTPSVAYPGDLVTYTLVVSNPGPSLAAGVRVTDVLPSGASVGVLPSGCSGTSVITCAVSDVPVRQTRTVTLAVTLPNSLGTLTNTVEVRSTTAEREPADNFASVTVLLIPRPGGSVVITGPLTTTAHVSTTFTANLFPTNTTQPITYVWQAQGPLFGPAVITNANRFAATDIAVFRWRTGGVYLITAQAQNVSSIVTGTYAITVENPGPSLTSLLPITGPAGMLPVTLTLNGSGFVLDSVGQWQGAARSTTFVNPTQLQVALAPSDWALAGFYNVDVVNPGPGGGTSNGVVFTVTNPGPQLNLITPPTVTVNSPTQVLTLTGNAFNPQSIARWDGADLPTTLVNPTTLNVVVTDTLLTSASAHNLTVFNPAPGGGLSAARPFTVTNPRPSLLQLDPATLFAGSVTATVNITGTNFVMGAQAFWGATPLETTRLSSTHLQVVISTTLLTPAGNVNVTVDNPGPNDGVSNVLVFTRAPLPITLEPPSLVLTLPVMSPVALTATVAVPVGNDTVVALSVTPTTVVSVPTSVVIPAGEISVTFPVTVNNWGGNAFITATLPGAVGGLSSTTLITVNRPAPTLNTVTPPTATVGGMTLTLTLNGSDFGPQSQVFWAGQLLNSTFVNSAMLTAIVPTALLDTPTAHPVTVTTPAPGGGTTPPQTVTLSYPTITLSPTVLYLPLDRTRALTATVSAPLGLNTTIVVTSSNMQVAQVPLTVLLNSGLTQVTFPVVNQDPPGQNGTPGTAFVTTTLPVALGSGFASAEVNTTQLLFVPNPITRTGGLTVSFLVTLTRIPQATGAGNGLTIDLEVDNPAMLQAPATIQMDGVSTVSFVVTGTTAGIVHLTATDNSAGGPYTDTLEVRLLNPAPVISNVTPGTGPAGQLPMPLTIVGSGFVPTSVGRWNNAPRTTTYVSPTQLQVTLALNDWGTAGFYTVSVSNPGPGGGVSAGWPFTVSNPAPGLNASTPPTVVVNSPTTVLTLTGSAFMPTSIARWNGANLPTGVVNASTLTATVTNTLLTSAGVYSLTVFSPGPGGGVSAPVPFTVTNPVPGLSSIAPLTTTVNGPTFVLTLTGSAFVPTSIARWNGLNLPTGFVGGTTLTATVTNTLLTSAGVFSITVFNPTPGGGVSATRPFTVTP